MYFTYLKFYLKIDKYILLSLSHFNRIYFNRIYLVQISLKHTKFY